MILDDFWTIFGRFLDDFWTILGRFLADFWPIFGRFLADFLPFCFCFKKNHLVPLNPTRSFCEGFLCVSDS
jgi:hypothetical protein